LAIFIVQPISYLIEQIIHRQLFCNFGGMGIVFESVARNHCQSNSLAGFGLGNEIALACEMTFANKFSQIGDFLFDLAYF
jgi:hypothetical protein